MLKIPFRRVTDKEKPEISLTLALFIPERAPISPFRNLTYLKFWFAVFEYWLYIWSIEKNGLA
jgi:hypothetical protein